MTTRCLQTTAAWLALPLVLPSLTLLTAAFIRGSSRGPVPQAAPARPRDRVSQSEGRRGEIDRRYRGREHRQCPPEARRRLRPAGGLEQRRQGHLDERRGVRIERVHGHLRPAHLGPRRVGQYTVGLVLQDAAAGVHAENDAIPLEVVEPPPPPAAENPIVPGGLTAVIQAIHEGSLPLAAGLGLILAALLVALLAFVLVRRRRRASATRSGPRDGQGER